jgi:uncharacterized protein (DUF362 family)
MGSKKEGITRRRFLEMGINISLLSFLGRYIPSIPIHHVSANTGVDSNSVVIGQNGDPSSLVDSVFNTLGGIEKFVKNGDRVMIKPNASFNYKPDRATTTNPEIASAVVELCFNAGASEVLLADHLLMTPASRTISNNGLRDAAEIHGAEFMVLDSRSDFQEVEVQDSKVLKEVEVASIYFESDVFINLPTFKHHSATGSTLGMKNLMGLIWDRQVFHRNGLESCIADLSLLVKPQLTIIDATRGLMTNGPRGPGEVKEIGQIIAGTDPVAVDTAALSLGESYGYNDFSRNGFRNKYIDLAAELGIGDGNPESVREKTVYIDAGGIQSTTSTELDNIESRSALPTWTPYAALSAASIALGSAALFYSKRRGKVEQDERR